MNGQIVVANRMREERGNTRCWTSQAALPELPLGQRKKARESPWRDEFKVLGGWMKADVDLVVSDKKLQESFNGSETGVDLGGNGM
jgi:hypothetical protein